MDYHQLLNLGLLLTALGAASSVAAAEWEDVSVNEVNRLPARAYTASLTSLEAALSDKLVPDSPYELSLNGDWRFRWFGNPALAEGAKDFYRTDFDVSRWDLIDVPSCVEMRGYGTPGYSNQEYPTFNTAVPGQPNFAKILDFHTKQPDYNPTSFYRREFTIPEGWSGRRTILRFEGVGSAYYVWVNGEYVGYAEDSKLPSEFDITGRLVNGINTLAVKVLKWCDGSFLEDQDFFRYSGIFRDVSLVSIPKDGIWDIVVRTTPIGGCERWKVEVEVEGEGTEVALYDADKNKISNLHCSPSPSPSSSPQPSTSTFTSTLAPHLWSAEKPYLYTLVVRRGDDFRRLRVGFKEQHIDGAVFKVNGQPIKFHGVNRHDTTAENGRTVTLQNMLDDLQLMKRFNIDTVRTSHYPNPRLWYDLCDKYGVYLVAEANIEGHGSHFTGAGEGLFPEWQKTIVERNVRHVKTYRNHVAITLWSLGNETEHGPCFVAARDEIRKLDGSRPIHWERGNVDADVDSAMYPSVGWLERRGQLGDGKLDSTPPRYSSPQFKDKCFFLCEYAHAMGNAVGNLQEYWDVFYAHPSLAGGCIWDWVDQAVWKYTGEVDPKTGKRERYLAYGGDWDEDPNDGPFCDNGIVRPDRKVTAKLIEVGHVYRPLAIERDANGACTLVNRLGFTNANEFDGEWECLADGARVAQGAFDVPDVPPLGRAAFPAPESFVPKGTKGEIAVNCRFKTRQDAGFLPRGHVVAAEQLRVTAREVPSFTVAGKVEVVEDDRAVTVRAGGTKAVFCRKSGTLAKLVMNGRTVLEDPLPGVVTGPRLTCMRAFVDNDKQSVQSYLRSGLTQLKYHAEPFTVTEDGVEILTRVTGRKSGGFAHTAKWRFSADGSIVVENAVRPFGTIPKFLPRLGLSLRLKGGLENVRFYGAGPHENYLDRRRSAFLGLWSARVSALYEEYVRPQDNGRRGEIRWVEFKDAEGRGVRFAADAPLSFQALHCSREDLDNARHRVNERRRYQPVPTREDIYLDLDIRETGLGGGSCGPAILDTYTFDQTAPVDWKLKITPI